MKRIMISQPNYLFNSNTHEHMCLQIDFLNFVEHNNMDFINNLSIGRDLVKNRTKIILKKDIQNLPLFLLSKSLETMAKCDAIYFNNGWEEDIACQFEHYVASYFGLEIIYAHEI